MTPTSGWMSVVKSVREIKPSCEIPLHHHCWAQILGPAASFPLGYRFLRGQASAYHSIPKRPMWLGPAHQLSWQVSLELIPGPLGEYDTFWDQFLFSFGCAFPKKLRWCAWTFSVLLFQDPQEISLDEWAWKPRSNHLLHRRSNVAVSSHQVLWVSCSFLRNAPSETTQQSDHHHTDLLIENRDFP